MDTTKILFDLRTERDRMDRAISVLEVLDGTGPVRSTVSGAHPTPAQPPSRRIMTAAGRRKIAEARKKAVGGAAETERQGCVGRPLLT
jgi:hypothetical protein